MIFSMTLFNYWKLILVNFEFHSEVLWSSKEVSAQISIDNLDKLTLLEKIQTSVDFTNYQYLTELHQIDNQLEQSCCKKRKKKSRPRNWFGK